MTINISKVKSEIIDCVHEVYRSGLQTGTGGNFSYRIPGTEHLVIKPTGYSFVECNLHNLVIVDLEGNLVAGEGLPSSEINTHLWIYRLRKDVGSILHCHHPLVIAYAEAFKEVTSIAYHFNKKLGKVPILRTHPQAEISEDQMVRILNDFPGVQSFIHAKHGIFSFGESLLKARFNLELVIENLQTIYDLQIFKGIYLRD